MALMATRLCLDLGTTLKAARLWLDLYLGMALKATRLKL